LFTFTEDLNWNSVYIGVSITAGNGNGFKSRNFGDYTSIPMGLNSTVFGTYGYAMNTDDFTLGYNQGELIISSLARVSSAIGNFNLTTRDLTPFVLGMGAFGTGALIDVTYTLFATDYSTKYFKRKYGNGLYLFNGTTYSQLVAPSALIADVSANMTGASATFSVDSVGVVTLTVNNGVTGSFSWFALIEQKLLLRF
jgi:hypothetical protein